MIPLRWLNAALAIFGSAMFLCMGVVCLMYWVYLDANADMRAQFPMLLSATLLFGVMGAAGSFGFYSLMRRPAWLVPSQIIFGLLTLGSGFALWRLLTA